jgi:hypothetical protein
MFSALLSRRCTPAFVLGVAEPASRPASPLIVAGDCSSISLDCLLADSPCYFRPLVVLLPQASFSLALEVGRLLAV